MLTRSDLHPICQHSGCVKPVKCINLCAGHYRRFVLDKGLTPCACGCGEMAVAIYVSGHHTRLLPKEEQSRRARFNDGSTQRGRGAGKWYVKVRGRHEHRLVAEEMLGRPLEKGEIVHHKNGNKRDNAPSNLEVMTQREHINSHREEINASLRKRQC